MTTQDTRSYSSDLRPNGGDRVAGTPQADSTAPVTGDRTSFAKSRTSLALDRTTLAWIRTTLTFATFGFGMIGFFRAMVQTTHSEEAARLHQGAIRMGVALVVIGMVATILAAISH